MVKLLEKDLEDLIFEDLVNNNGKGIKNRGLSLGFHKRNVKPTWYRQLNIDPYGIIDIVGFYRYCGMIHVELLELKIVEIKPDHFEQIARYFRGLEIYLQNTFGESCQMRISPTLIGEYYSGCYFQNLVNISVASYRYTLDGVTFDLRNGHSSWYIVSDKPQTFRKQKDYAKKVY